jgi:hypothetical protein
LLADGFCNADAKLFGPVQAYVTPNVPEFPERVTEGFIQPRGPLTPAVAPGTVVSFATLVVAMEIHPFAGLVTVKVYVPTVLTIGFCMVDVNPFVPVQKKLTPEVPELPDSATEVAVQVKFPPFAVAPGPSVFEKTEAATVEVQPLTGLVTVSV